MSDKKDVKELVCQFYLDNKKGCDSLYHIAESYNVTEFYEVVEDEEVIRDLFMQVSVIVLTANKYEKNILHYNIYCKNKVKIKKIKIDLFPNREEKNATFAYWFEWGNYSILHIEAQSTGSYTIGGSADIVRFVIENDYIFPTTIISLGICFGADEAKYKLGDVVISDKVYPYFIGSKISEKGYFVNDNNMFRINTDLHLKIKNIIDENAFTNQETDVYLGSFITGEAVVSRKKARDEFVKITKQPVIAGEMEGYGIFKECNGSKYKISCLIIKSICDWASMKNFDAKKTFELLCPIHTINELEIKTLKDRIQSYCSQQAFDVLNKIIERQILPNSLYNDLVKQIASIQGRTIFASRIKFIAHTIANQHSSGMMVSDAFIINCIKFLIKNNMISNEADEISTQCDLWGESYVIAKET